MQILRSRPCIASSLLKTQTLRQALMPSGNDGFKGSLCIQCWPMVRKCQLSAVQIDFRSCLSYLFPSTFELISDRSGFVALSWALVSSCTKDVIPLDSAARYDPLSSTAKCTNILGSFTLWCILSGKTLLSLPFWNSTSVNGIVQATCNAHLARQWLPYRGSLW